MNQFRRFFVSILLGLSIQTCIFAQLTLQDIHTASDQILVLLFTSPEYNLDDLNTDDISAWTVNGKPAKALFRSSAHAEGAEHFVYLETDRFETGKSYAIQTPYGNGDIVFDAKEILCESIKTNQAGYSALSNVRYANFAIWTGTGGGRKIDGVVPGYEVIDQHSGEVVLRGTMEELGQDDSSGDFVYRIDLSEVSEGGPYKIVVEGYGSSWPFGIGDEFSRKLAYTIFRAQYLQRCGCPIEKPAIRKKACHSLVYDVDGPIGEANIEVLGNEPHFSCYGGYHDAGDADRRAYHIVNPIVNLMIYEAFPEYFFDGQYDIPGEFDEEYTILSYTNDIPDILDEAAWGTLVWEYLQNPDGSIHFGTETKGYPDPFDAPMDQDDKMYGTVKTDPRATCTGAGLFMHLARLIAPYDSAHSVKLVERAERAMSAGQEDMQDPEKLYYSIQKYLLTGDETSHNMIRELYTIVDSMEYHIFRTQGYSLNDIHFDNPAYLFSYVIEKERPTDQHIVEYFKNALRATADRNLEILNQTAYPVGAIKGDGWGRYVRQPMYAGAPMLCWSLTGEQKYVDGASQLMDYKLGLNPLGMSYVTGLGFHSPHNPHDRESAYTKKTGLGLKPGITIFGPGIAGGWYKPKILPPVDQRATERIFDDDLRLIYYTEFTIFETMSHDALYTVLAGGGKWNGQDPY
ncbi:MAG: glycoside hydrolase family 9 protein [Bacteroidales bacterium]|nr:glycoside hydrolase family 9 protein [Bacteroidales bacterium]